MRPSPAQIERVAEALVRRLLATQLLELDAPEDKIRARFAAVLTRNFDEEAEIERFMRDPRVAVLITNRPDVAMRYVAI